MSAIGPLAWIHWPRQEADDMATIVRDTYSDHDMQCPATWENGFKEGRIVRFGSAERTLSDLATGDWRGSTFDFVISDASDRRFREQLASAADRYWSEPLEVKMTTRANRAAANTPHTVFVGPIIDAHPGAGLTWEVTLGDAVSQGLLSDDVQIPWRLIRDGFLLNMTLPDLTIDALTPEPIIYGIHRRQSTDAASPQGLLYRPLYLGEDEIDGSPASTYHVWLVAGHAVADVVDVFVETTGSPPGVPTSILADEGTEWLIPHSAGWLAFFGAPYVDKRSKAYGNDRRYTLIYGLKGTTNADNCASGASILSCHVEGVEPVGDGTGAVIQDLYLQYEHWLANFVSRQGAASYQSGAWPGSASWGVYGTTVLIVDSASFSAAAAIGVLRLPSTDSPPPYPAGLIGAAIIGGAPGDRRGVKSWIAKFNQSSAARLGITAQGELRITTLHPTAAGKLAAKLYTDAYEILAGSFGTAIGWADQINRLPFQFDFAQHLGVYTETDVVVADAEVTNYGREITGAMRAYPFTPGITMATAVARLDLAILKHPPRIVTLRATVGHDDQGDSLGYRELGDYIRFRSVTGVSTTRDEIRLGQVVAHQVDAGTREVVVQVLDCEDLIGYDLPAVLEAVGSPTNDTCAAALVAASATGSQTFANNVTLNATDAAPEAVSGWTGPSAYFAYWVSITIPAGPGGTLLVSTAGSHYDTQIAVFSGSCGALVLDAYNDNDGFLSTSRLEGVAVAAATTYLVLAAGAAADETGELYLEIDYEDV